MSHKERKMGTMVERIPPICPANFFYNMVKIFAIFAIFANTSTALTPSRHRTPLVPNMKALVSSGGCPQPERGRSISLTIPNRKGAMQEAWIRAPYQKWPKKMQGARLPRRHSPLEVVSNTIQ